MANNDDIFLDRLHRRRLVLGDFNLDYSLKNNVDYRYANMYNDFDDVFSNVNLIQMVEFPTWSRIVNNVLRESILDHIYLTSFKIKCKSLFLTK